MVSVIGLVLSCLCIVVILLFMIAARILNGNIIDMPEIEIDEELYEL